MRLFFMEWTGKEFGLSHVVLNLKKQGHEIVYWSGPEVEQDAPTGEFPGTIFHDYRDAVAGRPAAECVSCTPAKRLIEEFAHVELVVLTMMNKKYEWMEIAERKHVYYHMLGYWHGVIEKHRPDAIIFSAIPHSIYDFVVYALARASRIKTIIFEAIWVNDRLVVMNDFTDGSYALARVEDSSYEKQIPLADVSRDLQEYYESHVNPAADTTPHFMKSSFRSYSGVRLAKLKAEAVIRAMRDLSFFEKSISYISRKVKGDLKTEYRACQSAGTTEEPFVYVPLHYQPERTTSPQGGAFVDQLLMIEMLSRALPKGWRLSVKEHPTQWLPRGTRYFNYRYKGFYAHIAALPNVRLIPIETDTYELIGNAQAVATVCGTAGWEAILRGKPAIVFGYPWYQHAPGVLSVHDSESCSAAMQKIWGGFVPDAQAVIQYLGKLDQGSIHGYLEELGRQVSRITLEENIENITKAIVKALSAARA